MENMKNKVTILKVMDAEEPPKDENSSGGEVEGSESGSFSYDEKMKEFRSVVGEARKKLLDASKLFDEVSSHSGELDSDQLADFQNDSKAFYRILRDTLSLL